MKPILAALLIVVLLASVGLGTGTERVWKEKGFIVTENDPHKLDEYFKQTYLDFLFGNSNIHWRIDEVRDTANAALDTAAAALWAAVCNHDTLDDVRTTADWALAAQDSVSTLIDSSWNLAYTYTLGGDDTIFSSGDHLRIVSNAADQLSIVHTEGVDSCSFEVDANGDLEIAPSGADINFESSLALKSAGQLYIWNSANNQATNINTQNDYCWLGGTRRLVLGSTQDSIVMDKDLYCDEDVEITGNLDVTGSTSGIIDTSYENSAYPYRRSFTGEEMIAQSGIIAMGNAQDRDTINFLTSFTGASTYSITLTPYSTGGATVNDSLVLHGQETGLAIIRKQWTDGRYLNWIAIGY